LTTSIVAAAWKAQQQPRASGVSTTKRRRTAGRRKPDNESGKTKKNHSSGWRPLVQCRVHIAISSPPYHHPPHPRPRGRGGTGEERVTTPDELEVEAGEGGRRGRSPRRGGLVVTTTGGARPVSPDGAVRLLPSSGLAAAMGGAPPPRWPTHAAVATGWGEAGQRHGRGGEARCGHDYGKRCAFCSWTTTTRIRGIRGTS
jgi:hypothetical protein